MNVLLQEVNKYNDHTRIFPAMLGRLLPTSSPTTSLRGESRKRSPLDVIARRIATNVLSLTSLRGVWRQPPPKQSRAEGTTDSGRQAVPFFLLSGVSARLLVYM